MASAVVLVALTPSLAARAVDCEGTSTGRVPVTELAGAYQGAEGGLYPGGANAPPEPHASLGMALGSLIVPRDAAGAPSSEGRIVLLTIGMSNTSIESNALLPLAEADPARDPGVTVVNGAKGGQAATDIDDPAAAYWDHVDDRLAAANVTPAQVGAVWLKQALRRPEGTFAQEAGALRDSLRSIVVILKARFPNLWHVYLSSRIYAGYADTLLNPEPYAYESAWAVKWLIAEQMTGTLPAGLVPWLAWGPYLWADGTTPRADGLTWSCSEFKADGTHPNQEGARKVAELILAFLDQSPSAGWYRI